MGRWKGAVVNEHIAEPKRPGGWVNRERCLCCGARYSEHRGQVVDYSWDAATQLVRSNNGATGGFRSRGPVLWAMRVLKLTDWYLVHEICGELWDGEQCLEDKPDPELELLRFEAAGRGLDAELADLPGWETDEEFGF